MATLDDDIQDSVAFGLFKFTGSASTSVSTPVPAPSPLPGSSPVPGSGAQPTSGAKSPFGVVPPWVLYNGVDFPLSGTNFLYNFSQVLMPFSVGTGPEEIAGQPSLTLTINSVGDGNPNDPVWIDMDFESGVPDLAGFTGSGWQAGPIGGSPNSGIPLSENVTLESVFCYFTTNGSSKSYYAPTNSGATDS